MRDMRIGLMKCGFCEYSSPDGDCFWKGKAAKVLSCEDAIKRMMKCLGNKK